ncbi:sigma-70 family RNA polymerase sigma factor [Hyphomicrobium sp. xq]|uniref:Sigma-70 family RNA polymerase sigma factor n=1 Tax=Hyphomicrobium album TaxID=2665159 RepID=A0A6I3KEX6_9HYPH|nr:RNA polymerase sigma factor [Hyphomicrobium album]MTD92736.1 sigma-70 family RNA polymerase sigma factor [Hyphomicrobium album]
MTHSTQRGALRALLEAGYADLKRRLARRLGSVDAASEVLHDTYLRLERFDGAIPIANPHAYLLRMVLNVAADRQRADKRLLSAVEVDELWRLSEDVLDAEAITAARSELDEFAIALQELPPRCQAILLAARVEELPHDVIAERFGISNRMVQFELRRALEHCAARLGRKVVRRFGPPPKSEDGT